MMIRWTEKPGLYDAIAAAGHWIENSPGGWVSSDDAAVQAIIDAYDPLPVARAQRLAELAAHRAAVQSAGFRFAGIAWQTDAEARANLAGAALSALLAAQAGEPYSVTWKSPGGPVVLDGATIMAAARAIEAWVRSLFAREAELAQNILSLSDWRAVLEVDVTVGWS
jgi:hypothetical protein